VGGDIEACNIKGLGLVTNRAAALGAQQPINFVLNLVQFAGVAARAYPLTERVKPIERIADFFDSICGQQQQWKRGANRDDIESEDGKGCSVNETPRMRDYCLVGWSTGWSPTYSGHIHYFEQRRPSLIGARATCEPCSWITRKLRVLFSIVL
jgi:hypothetical protein